MTTEPVPVSAGPVLVTTAPAPSSASMTALGMAPSDHWELAPRAPLGMSKQLHHGIRHLWPQIHTGSYTVERPPLEPVLRRAVKPQAARGARATWSVPEALTEKGANAPFPFGRYLGL